MGEPRLASAGALWRPHSWTIVGVPGAAAIAAIFALLAVIGFATVMFATAWGIGLSNDSVNYVLAARALSEGRGLAIVHYQPLYPVVLALSAVLKIDVLMGARWLNALLFSFTIVLIGYFIYRSSNRRVSVTLFGMTLLLTSVPFIRLYTYALSESLFMVCTTGSLFALCRYLESYQYKYMVGSAVLASLALLARYLGIPLIGVAVGALVVLGTRWRFRNAILFALIATVPTLLWSVLRFVVVGTVTDRQVAWHPLTRWHVEGVVELLGWLVPSMLAKLVNGTLSFEPLQRLGGGVRITLAAIGLTVAVPPLLWFLRRRLPNVVDVVQRWRELPFGVLVPFVIIYPLVVVASILLFDATTRPDSRILAPVQVVGVVMACSAVGKLLYSRHVKGRLRRTLGMTCGALAVAHGINAVLFAVGAHNDGEGYASREWQQSPAIARLRVWPDSVTVYTNQVEAVVALTNKAVRPLPTKWRADNRIWNDDYAHEMSVMADDVQRGTAVAVFLSRAATAEEPYRSAFPTDQELQDIFTLRLLDRVGDGAIYGVRELQSGKDTLKDASQAPIGHQVS